MSMKFLGQHFDIHGGGLDLVFPHHENEIVQSESFQRRDVRHLLAAQRPADQGGPEDLQVRPGHDRPDERPAQGARPRHDPDPAPVQPLPPADRLRPVAARRDRAWSPDLLEGLRAVRADHRRELPRARRARPAGRLRRRRVPAARGDRRAPPPLPRRDGRRLQHRRRPRRAVRDRPRLEPLRPRPDGRIVPP